LYDLAETEGAVIGEFSAATNAALLPHMQEGIAPKNPLDTGIPTTLKAAAEQCAIVARDPSIDIVAWGSPLPGKGSSWNDVHALRPLLAATDKPMIAFGRMSHQVTPEGLAVQEKAGFPFLQGLAPTLRAINALWFFAARAGRAPTAPPPAPASDLTPADLETALARYGIALAKSRAVESAEEAAASAASIGFPVALKIRAASIVHKTEAGGVVLDLANEQQVMAAADALAKAARTAHPQAKIDGFLVQEMVSGVETIVGAHSDPLYGPLLLLGSGGTMVELFRDVVQQLLPVGAHDIGVMIDSLKLARLLAGYRSRPPADRAALEKAALALGRFYLDHRARVAEIEINPLIVCGQGVVAVDVRATWREDPPR
jgi:acetyltransferase